jgi:hypothetical protein
MGVFEPVEDGEVGTTDECPPPHPAMIAALAANATSNRGLVKITLKRSLQIVQAMASPPRRADGFTYSEQKSSARIAAKRI